MEPRRITPLRGTPVNRLFLAINHYVSTGDHFGEGMALPLAAPAGVLRFVIPVNRAMEQDLEDFDRFRARFEQLAPKYKTELEDQGAEGLFHMWTFDLPERLVDRLARDLRAAPGPLGWGSPKSVIDEHEWHED